MANGDVNGTMRLVVNGAEPLTPFSSGLMPSRTSLELCQHSRQQLKTAPCQLLLLLLHIFRLVVFVLTKPEKTLFHLLPLSEAGPAHTTDAATGEQLPDDRWVLLLPR